MNIANAIARGLLAQEQAQRDSELAFCETLAGAAGLALDDVADCYRSMDPAVQQLAHSTKQWSVLAGEMMGSAAVHLMSVH